MPITTQARYLDGSDIGKSFTCQGIEGPRQILRIHHYKTRVEVHCQHPAGRFVDVLLNPTDSITITGQESPDTNNPHGQNTGTAHVYLYPELNPIHHRLNRTFQEKGNRFATGDPIPPISEATRQTIKDTLDRLRQDSREGPKP